MASSTAKIDMSALALKNMTLAQFERVQEMMGDGFWENQDEFRIRDEFGTIMVQVMNKGETTILLGIEKDGYAHS